MGERLDSFLLRAVETGAQKLRARATPDVFCNSIDVAGYEHQHRRSAQRWKRHNATLFDSPISTSLAVPGIGWSSAQARD